MRVEHLQQLNVRREDGDELALVPPLQPGGGQPPQGGEHLVADKRQKLEGDKVVARLLCIVQHAARQRKHQHAGKYVAQRQRRLKAKDIQQRPAAQHRNKDGAQKARHAHGHGPSHHAQKRPYKPHQAGHHGKVASCLFHAPASFPTCSSACWPAHSVPYSPPCASRLLWVPACTTVPCSMT